MHHTSPRQTGETPITHRYSEDQLSMAENAILNILAFNDIPNPNQEQIGYVRPYLEFYAANPDLIGAACTRLDYGQAETMVQSVEAVCKKVPIDRRTLVRRAAVAGLAGMYLAQAVTGNQLTAAASPLDNDRVNAIIGDTPVTDSQRSRIAEILKKISDKDNDPGNAAALQEIDKILAEAPQADTSSPNDAVVTMDIEPPTDNTNPPSLDTTQFMPPNITRPSPTPIVSGTDNSGIHGYPSATQPSEAAQSYVAPQSPGDSSDISAILAGQSQSQQQATVPQVNGGEVIIDVNPTTTTTTPDAAMPVPAVVSVSDTDAAITGAAEKLASVLEGGDKAKIADVASQVYGELGDLGTMLALSAAVKGPDTSPGETKSTTNLSKKELTLEALADLADRGDKWAHRAYVVERFVKKGFTAENGMAFAGRFVIESGTVELKPDVRQIGGGPGYGIAQWGSYSAAYDRFGHNKQKDGKYKWGTLRWFAEKTGQDYRKIKTQVDFVFWELENTETVVARGLRAAKHNLKESVIESLRYERPAAWLAGGSKRQGAINSTLMRAQDIQEAYRKALKGNTKSSVATAKNQKSSKTSSTGCYPGTESLGKVTQKMRGNNGAVGRRTVELCAIRTIKSVYPDPIKGANHRMVTQAKASKNFFELGKQYMDEHGGKKLTVGDSWRSNNLQTIRNNGGRSDPNAAAPTGKSRHEEGIAADFKLGYSKGAETWRTCKNAQTINSPDYRWMRKNAAKHGIGQYAAEGWHWDTSPNRCYWK